METKQRIGILTSGGDAPGMNAAVRAAIRTALYYGTEVFAIREGYQGMVDGGGFIYRVRWNATSGILDQGGTVIGTARCEGFKTREFQLKAAENLLENEIDKLIVIGGDGSLTGAAAFHDNWPSLLKELAETGRIDPEIAGQHPALAVVGLVCSIDNDMWGTDMTIGADTALHRISDAIDAINSTAAAHQRTFVVEVMGRNCGYLALMGALITGADYVFIPERPVDPETWKNEMCRNLKAGREAGRRAIIVIIAEGALMTDGSKLTSDMVKSVLEEELEADVRITILGHVQRGGSPSAYDRNLSSITGYCAVKELLGMEPGNSPKVIAVRNNRAVSMELAAALHETKKVQKALEKKDYEQSVSLRGSAFKEALDSVIILKRPFPPEPNPNGQRVRIGILHSGATAPGMNNAVRTAVRFCIEKGHEAIGITGGFDGLIQGNNGKTAHINNMKWMSVNGWASIGGATLGTSRKVPRQQDLWKIARNIEEHRINGLLIIGGWSGFLAAHKLYTQRQAFPVFDIPIICLPATISNNLPGIEPSVGADTAINHIVEAVDKIKQSAVALNRCFIVEVAGRYCGYLSLMSGLATGAEHIYLHENNVTLKNFQDDLKTLTYEFQKDRHLALVIRNEMSNSSYDTAFMTTLFGEESKKHFDVRHAILGHLQHGGSPSPQDRIQATRLARKAIEILVESTGRTDAIAALVDTEEGKTKLHMARDFPLLVERSDSDVDMGDFYQRAKKQWWMGVQPITRRLASVVRKMHDSP